LNPTLVLVALWLVDDWPVPRGKSAALIDAAQPDERMDIFAEETDTYYTVNASRYGMYSMIE